MVIAAIDVGFAATGFARLAYVHERGWGIVHAEAITTASRVAKNHLLVADDDARRMGELAERLHGLLDYCDAAVVELPGGGAKSARALRAMALASGAVVAVLRIRKLPVEWYTPQQTRIAGGGAACASKAHVIRGAHKRFTCAWQVGMSGIEEEAVADALATFMAAEREGNIVRMAEK